MTWTTPEPHPGICCWNAAGWLHQQWGNDQWMLVIVLSTLSIFLHFIPNQIWALPRHHCNIPRILQARFDRTKRPNKVGKSPGGSSKISHQSIEIFHGSSRTLMCENPLCGPYLAWQAVVKSWGLTSSSGKCYGESMGNTWKYMEIWWLYHWV